MENFKIYTMAEMAANGDQPDILFWVGCAGSYDARAQRITEAFCKLMHLAGIKYAVLGTEESCTGDPARRAGNEFLFQMLALQNIEVLNMYEIKKIVTACPHCFNTLKNEYPELGGTYDVVHHTQFLSELIQSGKLKLDIQGEKEKVSYHDSCYLGRVNEEYEAPRNIISFLKADLVEMKRNKSKGLCCGAGGAQMFKEEEPGGKRVNIERTEEALETGARTILVNCPFCMTMMSDGIKAKEKQDDILVYDLAEYIIQKSGIS